MSDYALDRINLESELPELMRRINALEFQCVPSSIRKYGTIAKTTSDFSHIVGGLGDTFYASELDTGDNYIVHHYDRDGNLLHSGDSLLEGDAIRQGGRFAFNGTNVFQFFRTTGPTQRWVRIYDADLVEVDTVEITDGVPAGSIAATTEYFFLDSLKHISGYAVARFELDGTFVDGLSYSATAESALGGSGMFSVYNGRYVFAFSSLGVDPKAWFDSDGTEIDAGNTFAGGAAVGLAPWGPLLFAAVPSAGAFDFTVAEFDHTSLFDVTISTANTSWGNRVCASQDGYIFIPGNNNTVVLHLGGTEFYRYPASTDTKRQSLGYPDGGENVPADESFNGSAAWNTLTLTANAANNETVTIDGQPYTYKNSLTPADYEVLIGGSASASIDNLIEVINYGGTGGLTIRHPSVRASAGAGDTMIATAIDNTSAGDSIATTDTLANGSWTASTLGGANPSKSPIRFPVAKNVIQDMRAAIEAVAERYINADTGDPFNWTDSDPDNLYWKANGEGSDYDWVAPLVRCTEAELVEIDNCLTLLEASERI